MSSPSNTKYPSLSPTRIYRRHAVDSTRWQVYLPLDDDIVISTAPKSGTTWTQAIARELIVHAMRQAGVTDPAQFPAPDDGSSFWMEGPYTFPIDQLQAKLEAQPHRRFLKSHLPLDGLPFYPQVKYLIIGRDQRDVFMSLWNYYSAFSEEMYDPARNPEPRCPADIHDFWRMWISSGCTDWEQQGYPFIGSMYHVQSWWNHRHLDNILLIHYADLKADPLGEIRCIADFLEIEISDEALAKVADQTSFGNMRQRAIAAETASEGQLPRSRMFRDGVRRFFHKGTNGRWQGVLTEAELAMYEQVKARLLTPDCARWVELGRAALA